MAQPGYLARILPHKQALALVWAQQARQPVWVAYLTQRGPRHNKLPLAVSVPTKAHCRAANRP